MAHSNQKTGKMAMDGFGRVKPLTEGYLSKGGQNSTSKITARPPAPAPMRPASSSASSQTPSQTTRKS